MPENGCYGCKDCSELYVGEDCCGHVCVRQMYEHPSGRYIPISLDMFYGTHRMVLMNGEQLFKENGVPPACKRSKHV